MEEHRDDERERKRESRARAAPRACPEGQVSPEDAPREAISLADLRGEVLEKIDKTLRFWDERERQSLDIPWEMVIWQNEQLCRGKQAH